MNSRYERLRCFSLFHRCADLACDATDRVLDQIGGRYRPSQHKGHRQPLRSHQPPKHEMPAGGEVGPEA